MATRNEAQRENRNESGGDEPDAVQLAMQMGMGFVNHDKRNRQAAIDAFAAVDEFQFQHVEAEVARAASEAYVDALWEKDEIEEAHTVDGELDREALDAADWSPVEDAFAERASLAGIDPAYAELTTVAWRRHKTGGDYWTPMKRAQMYELRAALQDDDYPYKPRDGLSGSGPEPTRYVLGVELHDVRRFEEGLEAMMPYFQRIIDGHRETHEEWVV
ncbi:hypothetical protein [Halobaculum gomorrense]|uniref:Uncharacterized protein n=1 Tax=Halobaculum gomorrense TaxID=43928 RepID=A0A1M5UFJ2_9EURY|nr:hypothetical protein [Halobaculum gomorrense]SHH61668.1 hypothetical protein SAMN05443636_3015 [Halobaculum gomorrense]